MKPRSKKNKELRMQKLLLPELKEIDPHAYIVNASGQGLEKGDYRLPNLNLVIEGKNWATLSVQSWMAQAIRQGLGVNKSIVVFKNPKSAEEEKDFWAVVNFYDLKEWLSKSRESFVKEPDREMTRNLQWLIDSSLAALKEVDREKGWKITRMRNAAKVILKELKE